MTVGDLESSEAVLVTGGAGYLGSHCALHLAELGVRVVVFDSLVNGHAAAVERAAELSGSEIPLVVGDLRDPEALDAAFARGPFDAVVHFAALKSVPESFDRPREYEAVNVQGTARLCEAMERHGTHRMVYSSSAAVYGQTDRVPPGEEVPLEPVNPYGQTKADAEALLAERCTSPDWSVIALRYFNPVGAHPSGRLGEDPRVRSNLVPIVLDVAAGRREVLEVFGTDYETPDGTCIRDYIHVEDLSRAHSVALGRAARSTAFEVYNVGTGRGQSVLELVEVARRVTGCPIAVREVERRPGDPPVLFADASRIERELGWSTTRGLEEMLASAWNWWQTCPSGYGRG